MHGGGCHICPVEVAAFFGALSAWRFVSVWIQSRFGVA